MAPKSTDEETPYSLNSTDPTLATVPEDAPIEHAPVDTLGCVLTNIMGWRLEYTSLDTFLSQTDIHEFEDLLEFATYSFDNYHEMYNVLFCLEYIEQIIDIKVLSHLYWELDVQGDQSVDPQCIHPSTFHHHKCQARTQASKEFNKVLKVPAAMFATLRESGTPIKQHLEAMAYLGWPNDVGSLGNETYKTVHDSPPEGEPEPHVEPQVVHTAVETPTGGTSAPAQTSPQQGGGLFGIPRIQDTYFWVHMLNIMTVQCAINEMT